MEINDENHLFHKNQEEFKKARWALFDASLFLFACSVQVSQ